MYYYYPSRKMVKRREAYMEKKRKKKPKKKDTYMPAQASRVKARPIAGQVARAEDGRRMYDGEK